MLHVRRVVTILFSCTMACECPSLFAYSNVHVSINSLCDLIAGSTPEISKRFILVNLSKTWLEAEAHCRQSHTNLARVRSLGENKLLAGMIKDGPAWIGLTEKSWKWSDGSEFLFEPWPWSKLKVVVRSDCGLLRFTRWPRIELASCAKALPFFCYRGKVIILLLHSLTFVIEISFYSVFKYKYQHTCATQ